MVIITCGGLFTHLHEFAFADSGICQESHCLPLGLVLMKLKCDITQHCLEEILARLLTLYNDLIPDTTVNVSKFIFFLAQDLILVE